MAREWTKSQLAAITTQDADVLVSAAAGSGKTAVLVERIIQKITNETKPVDIDRLLVVTFTNAAAAEMRQRIADALNEQLYLHPENENLHRQLALLSGASITTIHGFCHSLLREHFALLDLDPTFKIADTTENDLLRVAVLDRVIEEMYEDPVYADSFLQLTEAYMQLKNQEGFYELVQSLFHFVMSLPSPEAWLLDATERFHIEEGQDFNETELAKDLVACGHDIIKSTLEKYGSMIQMLDNDDGQEKFKIHMELERNALAKLLEAETYDAFYEQINAFTFDRIPSSAKDSAPVYRALVQEMRDKIKNGDIKRLKIEMFPESGNEQLDMLCKLYPLMQALSETVRRLIETFGKEKRKKNMLDFNDLEHGCLHLLRQADGAPTELSEVIKARFDEILIDEYQDTSALQ